VWIARGPGRPPSPLLLSVIVGVGEYHAPDQSCQRPYLLRRRDPPLQGRDHALRYAHRAQLAVYSLPTPRSARGLLMQPAVLRTTMNRPDAVRREGSVTGTFRSPRRSGLWTRHRTTVR